MNNRPLNNSSNNNIDKSPGTFKPVNITNTVKVTRDSNNQNTPTSGLDSEDQRLLDSVIGKVREYKPMSLSKWLITSKIMLISIIALFILNLLVFAFMLFYSMFQLSIKMDFSNSIGVWKDFYYFGIFSPFSIASIAITLINLGLSIGFHFICLKYDDNPDNSLNVVVGRLSYYNKWNLLLFIFFISLYAFMLVGFYAAFFNYGIPLIIVTAVLIFGIFVTRFIFIVLMGIYFFKKH